MNQLLDSFLITPASSILCNTSEKPLSSQLLDLTRKMQLIVKSEAQLPSKSFDFNPDFCRDKRLFSQPCLR